MKTIRLISTALACAGWLGASTVWAEPAPAADFVGEWHLVESHPDKDWACNGKKIFISAEADGVYRLRTEPAYIELTFKEGQVLESNEPKLGDWAKAAAVFRKGAIVSVYSLFHEGKGGFYVTANLRTVTLENGRLSHRSWGFVDGGPGDDILASVSQVNADNKIFRSGDDQFACIYERK